MAGVVVFTELVKEAKGDRAEAPSAQGPAQYPDAAQAGTSIDAEPCDQPHIARESREHNSVNQIGFGVRRRRKKKQRL